LFGLLFDLSGCMLLAGLSMLRAPTHALIGKSAGGSSVLVNQLQYQPLEALEGLGSMAELHADLVWDSLLTFSGMFASSSLLFACSI